MQNTSTLNLENVIIKGINDHLEISAHINTQQASNLRITKVTLPYNLQYRIITDTKSGVTFTINGKHLRVATLEAAEQMAEMAISDYYSVVNTSIPNIVPGNTGNSSLILQTVFFKSLRDKFPCIDFVSESANDDILEYTILLPHGIRYKCTNNSNNGTITLTTVHEFKYTICHVDEVSDLVAQVETQYDSDSGAINNDDSIPTRKEEVFDTSVVKVNLELFGLTADKVQRIMDIVIEEI